MKDFSHGFFCRAAIQLEFLHIAWVSFAWISANVALERNSHTFVELDDVDVSSYCCCTSLVSHTLPKVMVSRC